MYNHGYIFESGFLKSFRQKEVVFENGKPAPWFNYSFLDFLIPRLNESFLIFEYGLGNSTRYFNSVGQHCYGVEHSESWYTRVLDDSMDKDNYVLSNDFEYVNTIQKTDRKFDIIIVDGILREECMKMGLNYLSEKGVMILDDSEKQEYEDSIQEIKLKGYKELKISGLKALGRHYSSTSVLYKINNCLEI